MFTTALTTDWCYVKKVPQGTFKVRLQDFFFCPKPNLWALIGTKAKVCRLFTIREDIFAFCRIRMWPPEQRTNPMTTCSAAKHHSHWAIAVGKSSTTFKSIHVPHYICASHMLHISSTKESLTLTTITSFTCFMADYIISSHSQAITQTLTSINLKMYFKTWKTTTLEWPSPPYPANSNVHTRQKNREHRGQSTFQSHVNRHIGLSYLRQFHNKTLL